jgi:hypothetical protein
MYEYGDYHILYGSSCGLALQQNPVERFELWDHSWTARNYALSPASLVLEYVYIAAS